jgi:hypothetical protein
MLKITTRTEAERTTLDLEGQLTGPWVKELEASWRACFDRPVNVLLCAVTFIDDNGKHLLAEMYQQGAELVAEGCMNKAIVQQITREKRRKRKFTITDSR